MADLYETKNTVKAIDFDGTLAKEVKPYDNKVAGPPIKSTINLVKKFMKDNEKIVIFTSRVCRTAHTTLEIRYARKLISAWCKQYLGRVFPITAEKHPRFEYWDNKAHRVETNTGRILAQSILTKQDRKMLDQKYYNRILASKKAYLKGREEGKAWAEDKNWSLYAED